MRAALIFPNFVCLYEENMTDIVMRLPKALLVDGEFDILRDDIVLYRKHLGKDGADVSHCEYKSHHAFLIFETIRSISDAV